MTRGEGEAGGGDAPLSSASLPPQRRRLRHTVWSPLPPHLSLLHTSSSPCCAVHTQRRWTDSSCAACQPAAPLQWDKTRGWGCGEREEEELCVCVCVCVCPALEPTALRWTCTPRDRKRGTRAGGLLLTLLSELLPSPPPPSSRVCCSHFLHRRRMRERARVCVGCARMPPLLSSPLLSSLHSSPASALHRTYILHTHTLHTHMCTHTRSSLPSTRVPPLRQRAFLVVKLSIAPIIYTGPAYAAPAPKPVTRESSLLEPRKRKGMSCYCVEEVDLDIFRGVFAEQWLKGKKHGSCQEALFFCTTCGPPAVQESMKNASGNGGAARRGNLAAAESRTPDKKVSAGKSSFGSTLKKLFGTSKSSSKADLSTASSKAQSSGQLREHGTRIMSAEEEELPTTPRTREELYLCVTCGSCYCRDHACDHHYSRQQRNVLPGAGDDADVPDKGYPYHSFFIGVPSFVSTHPSHLLQETSWGLLFPTVTVREIEDGTADLSKPLPFYERFEEICDSNAACGPNPNGSLTGVNHSFSRAKNVPSFSSSAVHTRVQSAHGSSGLLGGSPMIHQKTNSYVDSKEDRVALRTSGLLTPVGAHSVLSLPCFHSSPPESWSYLMFCAKCADRQAVRLQGKQCDNDVSRHQHLRRLGQLTALLAYFLLRGVRLELPMKFVDYAAKKHAQQIERQRSQQRAHRSIEVQRVGRASELVGGLEATATGVSDTCATTGGVSTSPMAVNMSSGFCVLSRTETDHVITRAAICGFSNSSYFCYMNSVLQCLLRCRIFAGPILHLDPSRSPGKLTTAMSRLLHQVAHQTYQDVRNGAVFAFVRSLRAQICGINALFSEDEQQDAQEFLITLLNGIGDEFDKGKTEEERKATRRVSFEGTLLSEVTCAQCKHCVPRHEMFMSLSIPIEKSIEDGIASLFTPTTLRGKDRYACEGCFKRMSPKEQQEHNALAATQAEAEKRARAEGKKLTKEQKEARVYADSLYSEAEVRTSLSHLGGSLAVHLLRFHYDPAAQDFIKVLAPVRVSPTIDLTPYASSTVVDAYKRMDKIQLLQRRFPSLSGRLLDKYLRLAKEDVKIATQRVLDDGYGVADDAHSRQSSSAAISREHVNAEPSNVAGDDPSDDVAGVGSVFGDATAGTSSAATPLNAQLPHNHQHSQHSSAATNGGDRAASAKTTTAGTKLGGKAAASAADSTAAATAAALCAITRDDFDPFGDRAPPRPSLVRRLVGIVAHRGSLHGGHYISYVRHATRPHVWFRCDDEDIDVVEEKYVLDHEVEVYLAFYE
ncbi:ubiquitin hydrolase [Novymonas esmeraldas]|uniref:ubiquitinyl hydrolase 1 n=1 Tax=Novymonas esmeraldas TaxID=1808958 RepID=A0AAW0EKE5_9TRYP